MRSSAWISSATITLLVLCGASVDAQTLAPPKLKVSGERAHQAKKEDTQTTKAPELQKDVEVITNATLKKESAPLITKTEPKKEKVPVITKAEPEVIMHEPTRAMAKKPEPAVAAANYTFKTPEGKRETLPVITDYYPKQLVHPFGKVDRHLDPRLMRAATIAQERAHAHSRSMCWHYVKEALLAAGVIDSRPKSEYARDAASDLVTNYGFKKLAVRDPFSAPVGSVLVYGTGRSVGHVEFRTKDGFVSDFRSATPSRRPLIGVYAKL